MTTKQLLTDLMFEASKSCVSLERIIDDNQKGDIPPDCKFIPLLALADFVEGVRETEKKEKDDEIRKKPIEKFLFIEDGSVDCDQLMTDLAIKNPEIKIVVYRQGSCSPQLKNIGE